MRTPRITATIQIESPEQMDFPEPGAWCPGTATITIDPQDGAEPIVLAGIESGGWLGYGVDIPASARGSAQAAGGAWGGGSLDDWGLDLRDDTEWHAGRHAADLVLSTGWLERGFAVRLTDERLGRLGRPVEDHEDRLDWEVQLREAISDAVMGATIEGLEDAEQEYLQALLIYRLGREEGQRVAGYAATLSGHYGVEQDESWAESHYATADLDEAREIAKTRWADDLGYHTTTHDGEQWSHPVCERDEIDGERPDDIPEGVWDDLTSYYRKAIEAEATWRDACLDAIRAEERGEVTRPGRCLEDAAAAEQEYGDVPATNELAEALGWEWDGEWVRTMAEG